MLGLQAPESEGKRFAAAQEARQSSSQLTWSSKCDERLPCSHCVNRREKCERPDTRPQAKVELPQQLSSPSQHHVNPLHIELFYHFEKVTQFTLTFREIWETMLLESFKVCAPYMMFKRDRGADQRITSTNISCRQSSQ